MAAAGAASSLPPGVTVYQSDEGCHQPMFILSECPSGDTPLRVIAALTTSQHNDEGSVFGLLRCAPNLVANVTDNGKKVVIPDWKTDKQGNKLDEVYLIPQQCNTDQDVIINGQKFTVRAGTVITYVDSSVLPLNIISSDVDSSVLPLNIISSGKRQAKRDLYKKAATLSIMENGERKVLATLPLAGAGCSVLGVRRANLGSIVTDYVSTYTEEIDGEMVTTTRTSDVKIQKYDGSKDGEIAKVTELGRKVLRRPHLVIPEHAIPSLTDTVRKYQNASAKYVSTFVVLRLFVALFHSGSLIHYTMF